MGPVHVRATRDSHGPARAARPFSTPACRSSACRHIVGLQTALGVARSACHELSAVSKIWRNGRNNIVRSYGLPNTLERKLPDLFSDDSVFDCQEDTRAN